MKLRCHLDKNLRFGQPHSELATAQLKPDTLDRRAQNVTQLANQSEATFAFANAAIAYCTLIDNGESSRQRLQRALAQLQTCALDLPETFADCAPELDSLPVPSRLAEIISTLQVDRRPPNNGLKQTRISLRSTRAA